MISIVSTPCFNVSIILLALTASGCGSTSVGRDGVKNESKDEKQDYTYHFTVNGCDTGEHHFDSVQAYCSGLKNEALNHYCAAEVRLNAWEQSCK